MRNQIDATEHQALTNSDLRESYEVFVQQTKLLEVCNYHDNRITDRYHINLVGQLYEFEPGLICNASEFYSYDETAKKYHYRKLMDEGLITVRFFKYDALQDAIAHATELLLDVDTSI